MPPRGSSGPRPPRGRGGPKVDRYRRTRRKPCTFCVEKVLDIDYKSHQKLKRFLASCEYSHLVRRHTKAQQEFIASQSAVRGGRQPPPEFDEIEFPPVLVDLLQSRPHIVNAAEPRLRDN